MSSHDNAPKGDKGQSFVELALITPLLLAALMVAVDFGVAYYMGNLIAVAAREGARVGSELEKSDRIDPANPNFALADAAIVRDKVQNVFPKYLTSRQIIITFYEDDPGGGSPALARVSMCALREIIILSLSTDEFSRCERANISDVHAIHPHSLQISALRTKRYVHFESECEFNHRDL